jgi:hypothetical protein
MFFVLICNRRFSVLYVALLFIQFYSNPFLHLLGIIITRNRSYNGITITIHMFIYVLFVQN